jgi:cytochrome bd ubiquinol oxidase subunit II
VAQAPRLLPGLTVTQAAAGQATLVALTVAVCCGAVVLVPSLALLYTLFLRGALDTPEHHVPGPRAAAPPGTAPAPRAHRERGWAAAALAGLVAGAGLLVFAGPAWAHALGVAGLVVCAVAVFRLTAAPSGPD